MDYRSEMIKVFNDTMQQIDKSSFLTRAVKESIDKQEYYIGPFSCALSTDMLDSEARIVVSKKSSFDAARSYGGKVCVLNFASATTPGGGVTKGSGAQEECLCRCSTLYRNLSLPIATMKFYDPHRAAKNPLHNDDIIYSPGVYVIKSDKYTNLYQPFKLDVITCAAPNLREKPSNAFNEGEGVSVHISKEDLLQLHVKRASAILFVAASHQVDHLILGAFGCGAFRNDPEIVAKAYKTVIPTYRHVFKTIEFAVYCRDRDVANYEAFKKIFG